MERDFIMGDEQLPYIKTVKKMYKKGSKLYGDGHARDILNTLIAEAEYKKRRLRIGNKIVLLNRGDVFISINELQLSNGFTQNVIRSRIKMLCEEGTIKKVARYYKGTHYTLSKYCFLQDKPAKLNENSMFWDEDEKKLHTDLGTDLGTDDCSFPNKNSSVDAPNQFNQVNQFNQTVGKPTVFQKNSENQEPEIPPPTDEDFEHVEFFDSQALSNPEQTDDDFPSNKNFENQPPQSEPTTYEPTQTELDREALLAKLDEVCPASKKLGPKATREAENSNDNTTETKNNTKPHKNLENDLKGRSEDDTDNPEYFPTEIIEPDPPPESMHKKTTKKISKKVVKKKTNKKIKKVAREKTNGTLIFEAYAESYQKKYGVEPLRNAMTNKICATISKQVGLDQGQKIVRFYLTSNHSHHTNSSHDLKMCIRDLQKLNTEMMTGRRVSSNKARSMEKFSDNVDVGNKFLEKIEREERQEQLEKQNGTLAITEGF